MPGLMRPINIANDSNERAEFESRTYLGDAYRERSTQLAKDAQADRLVNVRMEAVRLAYDVLSEQPATFDIKDVFVLANRFVEYAREGQSIADMAQTTPRFQGGHRVR